MDQNSCRPLRLLADGRLVVVRSIDGYGQQVLVSTGSSWAAFETVDVPYVYFGGKRAGVAVGETQHGRDEELRLNVS